MNMHRMTTRAMRGLWVAAVFAVAASLGSAQQAQEKEAAAPAEEQIKVGTTLENLQAAFDGESNAAAKYRAFAKKADEEGYAKAASLFRAAAAAEDLHIRNHAKIIKALGAEPKAEVKPVEVKTTPENLLAAIKGETYEAKVMYPAFLKKARADRNREAIKSFNWARNAEAGHAKLYTEASRNLEQWKAAGPGFYVCPDCGNTVAVMSFEKCPICFEPKDKFKLEK